MMKKWIPLLFAGLSPQGAVAPVPVSQILRFDKR